MRRMIVGAGRDARKLPAGGVRFVALPRQVNEIHSRIVDGPT